MKSKFQFKNQLSDMANTQLLQLIKDGFAAMKTGITLLLRRLAK